MNWTLTVTMTLGKEKEEYTETVDLDGDVREVLTKMANMRQSGTDAIENAYNSIIKSASKDWAVKMKKNRKT